MSKEKKEAKKAAKAEKKANKQPKNPEVVKSVISAITAVICVIAIVLTSVSITNKICDTNIDIADKYPAANGGAGSSDAAAVDAGTADDGTAADAAAADASADPTDKDAAPADDGTAADAADTSADTAAPADSSSSSNSSSSSSSSTPATPASSTSSAPVGSDIAKIVAYYNNAANATKAYKGTMKINFKGGTTTSIKETSFPDAAKKIANPLLPNDYPKTESVTASNGQVKGTKTSKKGETGTINKSINDYLVIEGDSKMSKLTPAGVASATCAKVNGGYKVTIKLKPETVKGLVQKPASHYSCMQVMDITEEDLKPFTLQECTVAYPGATLTAVVNDKGMLASYGAVNPMNMSGTLKWTAIKGTATLAATYKADYTFTY